MINSNSSEGHILDELCHKLLPTLPPGAPFLLKSLNDENISIRQLSDVVERFPTIAARLITLANSAWSSPVATVTSLDVACSRLGFGVVRSVSIALAISAPFNSSRCPAFNSERFWCNSLMVADASDWLAAEAPPRLGLNSATARTAGLLHNLGILWLTDKLPPEMQQIFIQLSKDADLSLNHLLRVTFDLELHDASGRLARLWDLPEPLIFALSEHPNQTNDNKHWALAAVIGMAVEMASHIYHQRPYETDRELLNKLSLPKDSPTEIYARLAVQYEHTRELANSLFQR